MTFYQGGCHCGAVRYQVQIEDIAQQTIYLCNCSICTKKGFLHLHVKPADFCLLSGKDALTEYRFNTQTARHLFCHSCGIHSYYISRSHPHLIDVNVRCLEGISLAALTIIPFDGQNWESHVDTIRYRGFHN